MAAGKSAPFFSAQFFLFLFFLSGGRNFHKKKPQSGMFLSLVLVALAVLIYAAPCILMALLSARLRVGSRVSPR
jgi:hypothetical protein